jgi:hypothetical protein
MSAPPFSSASSRLRPPGLDLTGANLVAAFTPEDDLLTAQEFVDPPPAAHRRSWSHQQSDPSGKVHFSSEKDDVSLYGTPKEELAPPSGLSSRGFSIASELKPGWVRNQLQNIFQPTDNKLAMKLFGSKKALIQERVRQKAAGHWIIHPCSSFR